MIHNLHTDKMKDKQKNFHIIYFAKKFCTKSTSYELVVYFTIKIKTKSKKRKEDRPELTRRVLSGCTSEHFETST